MKYCIYCGNKILTEAKFCSSCGKECNNIDIQNDIVKIDPVRSIKSHAYYFYKLGLNVTCISDIINEYNSKADNIYLKAPNHSWEHLSTERQSLEEFNSYSWDTATGFGLATGFHDLITIDLDNCTPEFLIKVLDFFSLPHDYEWVVLSGSGKGFHVYLFIDGFKENFKTETVIRLFPKYQFENEVEKVELLIRLHSILPPSIHPSNNKYQFVNCIEPKTIPKNISITKLLVFANYFFDSSKQKNMHKYKKKKENEPNLIQRIGSFVRFLNNR